MTVTEQSLLALENHWAVQAIGSRRHDAFEIAKYKRIQSSLSSQISMPPQSDDNISENIMEKVSLAYELAASEGLHALLHNTLNDPESIRLREQAQAGAYRAFELRSAAPIPSDHSERIFFFLHLSSLAYTGDRWTDLRRWIHDNPAATIVPEIGEDQSWDTRVLYRLFDCWVRLFRKNKWEDLNGVSTLIRDLRAEQQHYEEKLLAANSENLHPVAFRLVSLYNFAKATEILAKYMLQGEPANINTELDQFFEAALQSSLSAKDPFLEILLRWLHVSARRMVAGSLWWVAHTVNSRSTRFVQSVTKSQALFEMLPPQRVALQEQGLLDQASRAIVIELPTSGGKTVLAQFRILQALNQFDTEKGWVAYVAPTRALVAQLTRRLRRDFAEIGIKVEQLSGAIEVDTLEEEMLGNQDVEVPFHILVSTPEKLQYVIRNKKINRPLALIVMDEAHNIEDEERGLRIELLLATIKRDYSTANFLLLMPYVPNASELTRWLGGDAGKTISLGTSAWQPNERMVGIYSVERSAEVIAGWKLQFESLITTPKTTTFSGRHQVGGVRTINVPYSSVSKIVQTAAIAKVFSERGTSIAVAGQIPHVWSMARTIAKNLDLLKHVPAEISLVQRFLATEISPDFELIDMLSYGVGVHHAGLSDDTRALMEWLAEEGKLRILCSTTTIAQGINFPVSSVFMATHKYPYGKEMSKRAFWNLAGRAGRIAQESIGVVGIAVDGDAEKIQQYVSAATENLISRLVGLLDEAETQGRLNDLLPVIQEPQWSDFRCYIAHLWNEKNNLDEVLAETQQVLRNTFGYGALQAKGEELATQKAQALLEATKGYARKLAEHPENATLADATGFAPEGVAAALIGLNNLENKLSVDDWQPSSLFSESKSSSLRQLIGVMLRVPEISNSLREIGEKGLNEKRLAGLTQAWVTGQTIQEITKTFFTSEDGFTNDITNTCKAIYKNLTNSGPWGISALSKMPTSGLNFESLSDEEKRKINLLPSMIYYGVQTESAILMRMNQIPRSIAEGLGQKFNTATSSSGELQTVIKAREFLNSLGEQDWGQVTPSGCLMSGKDYRDVWKRLSGVE